MPHSDDDRDAVPGDERVAVERWSPFAELRKFDDVFNRFWQSAAGANTPEAWSIPLDVIRSGDDIVVKASLPGVKKDDVEVTIEDDVLTIRAEAAEESEHQESGYLLRERRSGAFYRAVRLPETVDSENASSAYGDGILTIRLPKREEKKARKLTVASAE